MPMVASRKAQTTVQNSVSSVSATRRRFGL
ncbi:MAG: hypothetical protein GAK39_05325 [Variovorax sp.]|nr:MAG: hypothetical protein GAK39_05325 [Variovorax sp.]